MWPFSGSGSRGDSTRAAVERIDVTEAYARTKRGAKLVDVRSPGEFRGGHVKNARNVPPELIKQDKVGIRRDTEVLVICLSGHRSARQARKLTNLGYSNVANVQGGFAAWRRAGLPTKQR